MTDQTAAILTTLRQRAAAGYLWLGLVADELERLQAEVDELRRFSLSLAYRVEAQSELLARRAEGPVGCWKCSLCGGWNSSADTSCNWCALSLSSACQAPHSD